MIMIDWVSIVRTSRRRFSSYKYIPGKIRRRKKNVTPPEQPKVEPPPKPSPPAGCPCCVPSRVSTCLHFIHSSISLIRLIVLCMHPNSVLKMNNVWMISKM